MGAKLEHSASMKVTPLIASALLLISENSHAACVETNWVDAVNKASVRRIESLLDRVAVRIETVLYETKGNPHFFIHVAIQNLSLSEIGVDLSDRQMIFFPNQCGNSDLDHREVVNERYWDPKLLDAQLRARLVEAFKSKQLSVIQPGKSLDYYTTFNNADGRQLIQATEGRYCLMSIRGQLCFTDGRDVWDVQPSPDMAIAKPITWTTIPDNALVIEP